MKYSFVFCKYLSNYPHKAVVSIKTWLLFFGYTFPSLSRIYLFNSKHEFSLITHSSLQHQNLQRPCFGPSFQIIVSAVPFKLVDNESFFEVWESYVFISLAQRSHWFVITTKNYSQSTSLSFQVSTIFKIFSLLVSWCQVLQPYIFSLQSFITV